MARVNRIRSRYYDGTGLTSSQLHDLLPTVLSGIGASYGERGDLVMAAWPELVGPELARMTEAVSFWEGVLHVRVHNSTLFALLARRERPRLLKGLRAKFPRTEIRNIAFRMG